MNDQLLNEYVLIRPHMLNLVECYELDDNIMLSAIGNYDGRVYERMLEWSRSTRLNQKDKLDGFDEYIKPMLAAKL
jgi:acyl-CoA oxidase